ncbi:hypothetical protein DYU11_20815 [Fibrisoma montanum]|uniref:Uncharacterized protein n=1 Tax=Fibrisoma montanum TaxID=2305895 RepID=A0A418M422_9BACT|nr:hypothetical protein [Fibrisoma montanum]RIV20491.1 hypothetical protein DYU11_20815 [Fibrisoma montanum]
MKSLFTHAVYLIVIIGVQFVGNHGALAQTSGQYAPVNAQHKGHWSLKTDPAIRGTIIRFYGSDSQQIYQESLPNQFIKLSPKNIRRLDQTLARLVDAQLVASAVTVSNLPVVYSEPTGQAPALSAARSKAGARLALDASSLRVQCYVPAAKPAVHLIVVNPAEERITIQLLSAENKVVYEAVSWEPGRRFQLDMLGMPEGTYQVRVKGATQQYQQPVTLNYGSQKAVVQIDTPAVSEGVLATKRSK